MSVMMTGMTPSSWMSLLSAPYSLISHLARLASDWPMDLMNLVPAMVTEAPVSGSALSWVSSARGLMFLCRELGKLPCRALP